ncbi:MAG: hypothetical protein ACJARW_001730, partial [Methylophilaceae bacterium]
MTLIASLQDNHLFKLHIFLVLVFALFHQTALALEPFVIKDIRVE